MNDMRMAEITLPASSRTPQRKYYIRTSEITHIKMYMSVAGFEVIVYMRDVIALDEKNLTVTQKDYILMQLGLIGDNSNETDD